MKVEGTSISAGCVAEAYHFAQCSTAAPNPNTEVVCCSENQCNNGFTSASFPAFHRGSSIALIAILWILKQVLVA